MDSMLFNLLSGDNWTNAKVVYDPVLGWGVEPIGGNITLVVSESVARRLVRYLGALRVGLRDVCPLP